MLYYILGSFSLITIVYVLNEYIREVIYTISEYIDNKYKNPTKSEDDINVNYNKN